MRVERKRLKVLKELLQRELASQQPNLNYVEDLQLSIERTKKEVAYQMVDNRVDSPTPFRG